MTTGVIIAGGRSKRFGSRDKALAACAGTPMIRRVARSLDPVIDELLVNCRSEQVDRFETVLSGYEARFVLDRQPDCGPLAGMQRAMTATGTERALVAACDLPLASPSMFAALENRLDDHDAIVPVVDGRPQPLAACYAVDPTRTAFDRLDRVDGRPVVDLLDVLEYATVDGAKLPGGTTVLRNVNTREDLSAVESILSEQSW